MSRLHKTLTDLFKGYSHYETHFTHPMGGGYLIEKKNGEIKWASFYIPKKEINLEDIILNVKKFGGEKIHYLNDKKNKIIVKENMLDYTYNNNKKILSSISDNDLFKLDTTISRKKALDLNKKLSHILLNYSSNMQGTSTKTTLGLYYNGLKIIINNNGSSIHKTELAAVSEFHREFMPQSLGSMPIKRTTEEEFKRKIKSLV